MPDPITVAVLGFWHVHAAEYAAQVHQHPDTKLVAVWDDDPARGRAAADAVDAVFVGDLDNLLARDDIDAVTVTTATSAHRAIMLRAAQAGKHIFTEKLLAPTVTEAEEIIGMADEAGVALEVSLPRLYHGYTSAIMKSSMSGRLGELTYCRIRLSHDGAIAGWLPDRFYDPDGCGGRRAQRPWMPSGLPHPALPRCTPGHGERDVRFVHSTPGRGPGRRDARILGWRDRCHRNRIPEPRPVQHRDAWHHGQPGVRRHANQLRIRDTGCRHMAVAADS